MRAHRFCFDDPERRRWQNPESILKELGLRTGFTFVDVGCGEGFFAVPAAALVGSSGKVYALDIDGEAIAALKREAEKRGLKNLIAKVGAAEEIVLCESCADIVFFGIVLHDFGDTQRVLANARTMMKSGGRLFDLDWKKEPMDFGPPLETRFSESEATKLLESAGFHVVNVKPSSPYTYVVISRL